MQGIKLKWQDVVWISCKLLGIYQSIMAAVALPWRIMQMKLLIVMNKPCQVCWMSFVTHMIVQSTSFVTMKSERVHQWCFPFASLILVGAVVVGPLKDGHSWRHFIFLLCPSQLWDLGTILRPKMQVFGFASFGCLLVLALCPCILAMSQPFIFD